MKSGAEYQRDYQMAINEVERLSRALNAAKLREERLGLIVTQFQVIERAHQQLDFLVDEEP